MSQLAMLRRNEHIHVPRKQKAKSSASQDEMCDDEAEDVDRIVSQGIELRVCEGEDDGEDWSRDVAEKRSPEYGYRPILPGGYGGVEIATKLVALCGKSASIRVVCLYL